jgi:hypothetical protein
MIDKQAVALINFDIGLKWGDRYRLIWAEELFETRCKILGAEPELLPKYSYLKECFILEKFFGNVPFKVPAEVKDWDGWEVIWAFEPLQDPNLAVCMFIIECLENGVKRSLEDHYDEHKKEFDAEVQEAYEILDNESPYIATMLQNKEAIVVPEMPSAKRLRDDSNDS